MRAMVPAVGQSVPRREGRAKVTGRARYVDDLTFPGMLHGATVRSPVPRGRITTIAFDPAIDWSAFTIVGAADGSGCANAAPGTAPSAITAAAMEATTALIGPPAEGPGDPLRGDVKPARRARTRSPPELGVRAISRGR